MLTRTLTTISIPPVGMAFIICGSARANLANMRRQAARQCRRFLQHVQDMRGQARQTLGSALWHEEALQ